MRSLRVLLVAATLLSLAAAQTAKLDTTTFVVMGEGLAAGMANFGLNLEVQSRSFPALVARQMGTLFPQPLIQGPGIGDVLGYPPLPVRLPALPQNRVRVFPPQPNANDERPSLFVFNLSVPGMRIADSVALRPSQPIVQRDMLQTSVNLILGFPAMILSRDVPLWTQLEYAEAMSPTMVLVELGYYEALDAATAADPQRIPDAAKAAGIYGEIIRRLRSHYAEVLATTIPDPLDTAYFSPAAEAASLLRLPLEELLGRYALRREDYITRNGLTAIGLQVTRGAAAPLPPGSVLRAEVAAEISTRVRALNAAITDSARKQGAAVYDLQAFFRRVRSAGAGGGNVTGAYLGGFYSLDGYYPGATGHALIANDVLDFINRTWGRTFAPVAVGPVAAEDPTMRCRAPGVRP